MSKALQTIGYVERVALPLLDAENVPAKIDTGADTSSIWCGSIVEKDGRLECIFFDEESVYYTGDVIIFEPEEYRLTRVANSFGDKELRYKVQLPLQIAGRTIRANFTLADRSQKLYPLLIGRRTLKNKFLVDVNQGSPLLEEEKARRKALLNELQERKQS